MSKYNLLGMACIIIYFFTSDLNLLPSWCEAIFSIGGVLLIIKGVHDNISIIKNKEGSQL